LPPAIFRTKLTATGEKSGHGFERVFASEWYAFFDWKKSRWLQATGQATATTLKGLDPGPREKFKLHFTGSITERTFQMETSAGKYMRCTADGSFRTNGKSAGSEEDFIFFETGKNELVMFNQKHNKYVRLDDDGRVHCNEHYSDRATKWTVPN